MRYEMYLACSGRNGIDVAAYVALHTVLDFAAVYDLIEMQQVQAIDGEAAQANARHKHQLENPHLPQSNTVARVGVKRRSRRRK